MDFEEQNFFIFNQGSPGHMTEHMTGHDWPRTFQEKVDIC
jgi:hypothetical protein